MSEPNKDDLADALSRLASGDAPGTPEGIPSEQVSFTAKQKKERPAAPTPLRPANPNSGLAPGAAIGKPSARPNAPGVQPPRPNPSAPARRVQASKPKPPKPVRPSAPTLSQPPVAPAQTAPADPSDVSSSLANVIDDDDAVIVPAPTPDVLAHHPAPVRVKRQPLYMRISFRRTIIPVLLTMGIALPGCAVWWLFQDEDSPTRALGLKFPIIFIVVGLLLLALGIANMLHVKQELSKPGT